MLTDRRNLTQSNGTKTMTMTMLRGAFLSLVLAAFAFTPSHAQAKCDPAADPDCKTSETKKVTKKKEQPKKETADAPKAKKNTSSGDAPADQGSERKTQTGNAPKPKKSASSEDRTEQITEENRTAAPKSTSGRPARVNPVEFDKATGKHCSGQDEFRVCW